MNSWPLNLERRGISWQRYVTKNCHQPFELVLHSRLSQNVIISSEILWEEDHTAFLKTSMDFEPIFFMTFLQKTWGTYLCHWMHKLKQAHLI